MTKCSSRFIYLTIILILSFSFSIADAQGDYLKEGRSGFEFGAAYAHQEGSDGYGGYIGVSIKGMADFGFSYVKTSLSVNNVDGDTENIDADAFSPQLSLHLVKQEDNEIGVNFATVVAYERVKYKRIYNNLSSGNIFSVGFFLYHNIRSPRRLVVQPNIGVIPFAAFYETESGDGDHSLKVAFSAGLSFFPEMSERVTARIEPNVGYIDGDLTVGIGVGIILAGQSKKGSDFDF